MRMIDYFERGAEVDPDRTAIMDAGNSYTFAEVQRLTR